MIQPINRTMKRSLSGNSDLFNHHILFFSSLLFGVLLINGCSMMKKEVDLIVTNAKVYTVDDRFKVCNTFAIKNGKFLEVGDEHIIEKYHCENIIDAGEKPVYPGFIDGHCHFYWYGIGLNQADLRGTKSFAEILEIVKAHHIQNPNSWIVGRGWDQNDWPVKAFPTNTQLNELFPETPVVLRRIDGHAVLVNQAAMDAAGISNPEEVKKGEAILEKGQFTGVFLENMADLFNKSVPNPSEEESNRALIKAQENCFAVGLTSVMDAGLDKDIIEIIDTLQRMGALKMRIDAMLTPNQENIDRFVKVAPYKTEKLHVHSIKLYADGALGSRGACMIDHYHDDTTTCGMIVQQEEFYDSMIKTAFRNDYQVNTHAIGDSAVRFVLKKYARMLEKHNDRRWRIEHAQIIHPDDFKLFKRFNIIPSIQSTHATSDMYWAEDRIGAERMKGAYAYKELLHQNGWLVNGTDFPIEQINPIYTFYSAVFRKDLEGYPIAGFQMENALSRKEALRSMTIWAAKGSFEEHEKGSIEAGKMADFVILDTDIMLAEETDITHTEVIATYLDGEKVF